jgi:hypothetical protein
VAFPNSKLLAFIEEVSLTPGLTLLDQMAVIDAACEPFSPEPIGDTSARLMCKATWQSPLFGKRAAIDLATRGLIAAPFDLLFGEGIAEENRNRQIAEHFGEMVALAAGRHFLDVQRIFEPAGLRSFEEFEELVIDARRRFLIALDEAPEAETTGPVVLEEEEEFVFGAPIFATARPGPDFPLGPPSFVGYGLFPFGQWGLA